MSQSKKLEFRTGTVARLNGGSFLFFPAFPSDESPGADQPNPDESTVTVVRVGPAKHGPSPLATAHGGHLHIPLERKSFGELVASLRRLPDGPPMAFTYAADTHGILTELTVNDKKIIGGGQSYHRELKGENPSDSSKIESA